MRPERLELAGFTTFREPTVVDFSGVDLCAFAGPTGAGKSSLIDAMVFALYGSIPRYDDKRRVAPAISQGLVECRVRLDFTVEGASYSAVRVVRATATGGASTREARLERHRPGGPEVLAGDADELSAATEALLGLSFEHFTTCVVLPQGEFSRFLHAKPKDRQALLVRLLDLGLFDRMGELARQRVARTSGRLEQLDDRLAELPLVSVERRAQMAQRAAELGSLLERIDAATPRMNELDDQEQAARARARGLQESLDRLARVVRPEGLDGQADELARAAGALAAAEDAVRSAEETLVDTERTGDGERPRAELEQLTAVWADHGEATRLLARGVQAAESAVAADMAAERAFDESADLAEVTAAGLVAARNADLAATVATMVTIGDRCPVCGSEVHELTGGDDGELARAEIAAADAAAALERARRTRHEAAIERSRVEEKLTAVRERVTRLDQRLHGAPPLDSVERELARCDERDAATTRARAAVAAARDTRDRHRAAQERLTAQDRAGRNDFERARDQVGGLDPPQPDRVDLVADWDVLIDWVATTRDRIGAELAETKGELAAMRDEAERLAVGLEREAMALGVSTAKKVRDAVVLELSRATTELERIDETVETHRRLTEERTEVTLDRQVADALAGHLRSNRFQKWVLDEALLRLVEGATGLLHQLSGGAFSLTLEEKTSNFAVVDHRHADATRSARTLSGGETFLASLALALALADQVADLAAGGTVHLESIFLDEGFGTLDPSTLDIVAGAIEELGAAGRMVGLVSHVRELALRLPVRFEVVKGPRTSTVERVAT